MENIQIMLIVFGSSATIMIVLIIFFKWMSIKCRICCCCRTKKDEKYKVNNIDQVVDRFFFRINMKIYCSTKLNVVFIEIKGEY